MPQGQIAQQKVNLRQELINSGIRIEQDSSCAIEIKDWHASSINMNKYASGDNFTLSSHDIKVCVGIKTQSVNHYHLLHTNISSLKQKAAIGAEPTTPGAVELASRISALLANPKLGDKFRDC